MKQNHLKTILGAAATAVLMAAGTTSCVSDLDVENINPQQTTELNTDALLNKIYSSFVLTGQTGPAGNGDIKDADEGRSEFYRMVWNLNELTTDEAHWIWYTNDTGYEDLVENTVSTSPSLCVTSIWTKFPMTALPRPRPSAPRCASYARSIITM